MRRHAWPLCDGNAVSRFIAFASLLGAGCHGTALAQEGTANAFPMVAYAQCLVRHNSTRVGRVLEPESRERFDAAVSRLATKECNDGAVPSAASLRGPLFRAAYTKFGPAAGRSAANVINNWAPKLPADDPMVGWYQIGSCLVGKAPDAVRDLVRAAPGSENENARLAALAPQLSGCLPGGQQFAVNRATLTGVLAEIVYRVDVAPPLSAWSR